MYSVLKICSFPLPIISYRKAHRYIEAAKLLQQVHKLFLSVLMPYFLYLATILSIFSYTLLLLFLYLVTHWCHLLLGC